jgi:hypothetical protein
MAIKVIPRDQISYGDNVINYWKTTCALPKSKHPAVNNNGSKDEMVNSPTDPFFYLSSCIGGPNNRSCNVPSGKGLFIPALAVVVTEYESPGSSVEALRDLAKTDQKYVNDLSVELDGVPVLNIDNFMTSTRDFRVDFPDDPIFKGTGPRNSVAVADGRYIVTEPLSEGKHTVRINGNVRVPAGVKAIESSFDLDLTYNLTVS